MIITAAKRIINSEKVCRSYCNFYFSVTFLEHSVIIARTLETVLCCCEWAYLSGQNFWDRMR